MTFRICPHNEEACECSDLEMQPCLAALIENYLDALARLTPGDSFSHLELAVRRRDINDICRTFPTWDALKVWFEEPE